MTGDQAGLRDIAAALNADAAAFTVFEIADGVTVTSPAYDGIAAYQVLLLPIKLLYLCSAATSAFGYR